MNTREIQLKAAEAIGYIAGKGEDVLDEKTVDSAIEQKVSHRMIRGAVRGFEAQQARYGIHAPEKDSD